MGLEFTEFHVLHVLALRPYSGDSVSLTFSILISNLGVITGPAHRIQGVHVRKVQNSISSWLLLLSFQTHLWLLKMQKDSWNQKGLGNEKWLLLCKSSQSHLSVIPLYPLPSPQSLFQHFPLQAPYTLGIGMSRQKNKRTNKNHDWFNNSIDHGADSKIKG